MSTKQGSPGRSFLGRLMHSGISAFATKILGMASVIFLFRLVSDRYTDPEVATFVLVQSISMLGVILGGMGMGPITIRRLREAFSLHNDARRVLRVSLLVALVGTACSAALAFIVCGMNWFQLPLHDYRAVVATWIILGSLVRLVSDMLKAEEMFFLSGLLGGQNAIALPNIFTALTCLLAGSFPLEKLFYTQLASTAACLLIGGGLLIWRILRREERTAAIERRQEVAFGSFVWAGLPIVAAQLAALGIVNIEAILVGIYATPGEIAAYGGIRRIITLVGAPLLLINTALPTFIVDLSTQKRFTQLERLARSATTLSMLPCLAVLALIVAVPGTVLSTLFTPRYLEHANTLRLMAIGSIPFVLAGSFGLVMQLTGKQHVTMANALGNTAIYLSVAPFLIHRYGILGAAIAYMITTALRSCIGAVLVKKYVGIWTTPSVSALMSTRLHTRLFKSRRLKQD